MRFGDAVEPALQLYFEDCCADGLPPWMQIGKTLIVGLGLLFLLPLDGNHLGEGFRCSLSMFWSK